MCVWDIFQFHCVYPTTVVMKLFCLEYLPNWIQRYQIHVQSNHQQWPDMMFALDSMHGNLAIASASCPAWFFRWYLSSHLSSFLGALVLRLAATNANSPDSLRVTLAYLTRKYKKNGEIYEAHQSMIWDKWNEKLVIFDSFLSPSSKSDLLERKIASIFLYSC